MVGEGTALNGTRILNFSPSTTTMSLVFMSTVGLPVKKEKHHKMISVSMPKQFLQ